MLNKENRSQLDKISSILGCDFGIADLDGSVQYSGSSNIREGDIVGVPQKEDWDEEHCVVERSILCFVCP